MDQDSQGEFEPTSDFALDTLETEWDTVKWIQQQAALTQLVPMAETELVVHSLAAALQRSDYMLPRLLDMKSGDDYAITHACNTAMLSIALAEHLALARDEVRGIGAAALLHDIGLVNVSSELLTKPGPLSEAERHEIEKHPAEGARMLSAPRNGNELAAVVAYEHHAWEDGIGGYPTFDFPRRRHFASRLVQVCSLYDALSTRRPWREAWSHDRIVAMLTAQAGVEVDAELVRALTSLSEQTIT